jgi:iron complex outermembrane receptor protein
MDIDADYHVTVGRRHDVIVGAGYRFIDESVIGGFAFSITPSKVDESVINLFAQDEIALGRRVAVTLGAKVERDSEIGWTIQPTARLMWNIVPGQQHAWAAVSRAVRTPSLGDIFGRYNYASAIGPGGLPLVIGALGNPAFQSEEVVSTEAGYRRDLGSSASVDVTAFVGRYDRLKTNEPLTPFVEATPAPVHLLIPVQFENLLAATTSGVEISAHWAPAAWWRIDGGYSTFHLTPRVSATSGDLAAASFDGNAPRAQWQLRSGLSLRRAALDLMLFHSGALQDVSVAAYTRADVHLELPLTRRLSLSVTGQNLFDPAHAEFAGQGAIVMPTLIPRSAAINLAWMSRR